MACDKCSLEYEGIIRFSTKEKGRDTTTTFKTQCSGLKCIIWTVYLWHSSVPTSRYLKQKNYDLPFSLHLKSDIFVFRRTLSIWCHNLFLVTHFIKIWHEIKKCYHKLIPFYPLFCKLSLRRLTSLSLSFIESIFNAQPLYCLLMESQIKYFVTNPKNRDKYVNGTSWRPRERTGKTICLTSPTNDGLL